MRVLVAGAGVIGTVCGAHLAAARGRGVGAEPRAEDRRSGRSRLVRPRRSQRRLTSAGTVVGPDASGEYDIVLVAVRRDQLAEACAGLGALAGKPAILFFGNNPAGRAAISGEMPGTVYLGFPGVGGRKHHDRAANQIGLAARLGITWLRLHWPWPERRSCVPSAAQSPAGLPRRTSAGWPACARRSRRRSRRAPGAWASCR